MTYQEAFECLDKLEDYIKSSRRVSPVLQKQILGYCVVLRQYLPQCEESLPVKYEES